MELPVNVFQDLLSLAMFVWADVVSIKSGMDQHAFVSKDMQTLPMFAVLVLQDLFQLSTKTLVNVKAPQYLMKTAFDAYNLTNVLETQLE